MKQDIYVYVFFPLLQIKLQTHNVNKNIKVSVRRKMTDLKSEHSRMSNREYDGGYKIDVLHTLF